MAHRISTANDRHEQFQREGRRMWRSQHVLPPHPLQIDDSQLEYCYPEFPVEQRDPLATIRLVIPEVLPNNPALLRNKAGLF